MRRTISLTIENAKKRFSGYLGLLKYRLLNLCVKANPAALLSIEFEDGGETYGLETIATVGQAGDYNLVILPNSNDLIKDIIKAMLIPHPEFKYEVKIIAQEGKDDREYLYLSMPDVDKERRDALNEVTDLLYDECIQNLNVTFEKLLAEVSEKLITANEDEKKEAKDELERLYNMSKDMADSYKKDKLDEIEEGYQKYLKEQEEKQQKKDEKAKGPLAGMSMKLFGEDDE